MFVKSKRMQKKIDDLNSKNEPTTLLEPLKVTFNIARLIGTIPLTLDLHRIKGANHQRRAKNDLCFLLLYLITFLFLALYSLDRILVNDNDFVIVSTNVVFVEALLLIMLVFVNVIGGYIFRDVLRKCISLVNDIDISVINFGIDILRNQDRIKKKIYWTLTLMFLTTTLRFSLAILSIPLEYIQKLTFFFAYFMKTFSKYQFVIIILSMSTRFENINNEIKTSSTKQSSRIFSRNLNILCRYHYKLCNAFRMVNVTFSAQLLVTVGVSVVDILFHSYYLYVGLIKKHTMISNYILMINSILWVGSEFFEIYILVRACMNTCELGNKIPMLLHEIRNNYLMKCSDMEKQIQMHSIQMLHQKLGFSALGFFEIDYSLLYSIVSAVATYLVIVIQFDDTKISITINNTTTTTA